MTDGMGVGSSETNLKSPVITTTLGNRWDFGANFLQSDLHVKSEVGVSAHSSKEQYENVFW